MSRCRDDRCDCKKLPVGHTYKVAAHPVPTDGRIYFFAEIVDYPGPWTVKTNLRHGYRSLFKVMLKMYLLQNGWTFRRNN
jgi:hypothetical protein